jgi:glycosyltransferase involved in cell wall biosynthesis
MRRWDQLTATQVTQFVANSHFVADRIRSFYGRESTVIHPPVSTEKLEPSPDPTRDYYLFFGQLVAYKRADIAIEAFNQNTKRLIVAGDGEQRKILENTAGSNITFVGRLSDAKIKVLLQNAKALIFPGQEDFGIIPVEAMACGTPVIAYRAGGIVDTISHNENGILFEKQCASSLAEAIDLLEKRKPFQSNKLSQMANRFSKEAFKKQLIATISKNSNIPQWPSKTLSEDHIKRRPLSESSLS